MTTSQMTVNYIPKLLESSTGPEKDGGWFSTCVHKSEQVQFKILRVLPNGEIPAHFHHQCWDYFTPIQGEGIVEVVRDSGICEEYPLVINSLTSMPPMTIHRIRNTSSDSMLIFLLTQSPQESYDHIRVGKAAGS